MTTKSKYDRTQKYQVLELPDRYFILYINDSLNTIIIKNSSENNTLQINSPEPTNNIAVDTDLSKAETNSQERKIIRAK